MSASALAPGLARKVKKILEVKTESPELIAALSSLSCLVHDNTPAARRGLRAAIEARGLDLNSQFLAEAETVTQALDGVQAQLDGLVACCAAISASLSAARATSAGLLSESDAAGRQLASLEGKRAMAAQFLDTYQLSDEEVSVLQAGRVGPEFFGALGRVRSIHEACRGLLRGGHQRAGLELMDQMAQLQEAGYEHLCRWVQAECRGLGEHDAPEVDPTLTSAVAALRGRPVLFKYCAEEVAGARHGALFQRFIVALTRGGPGGLPRPIEIHAHDPRRYVADMLAWAHQALCSEREFVMSLFGDGGGGADGGGDGGGDGTPAAAAAAAAASAGSAGSGGGADVLSSAALLDRIFESICRPLKVRVEQVLMMSPPLLLAYQLGQLTSFYHGLISDILGPSAALSTTVAGCRDLADRTFMEQLKATGDRLLRSPPPPPADLSPPPQVAQTLALLSDVIAAHDASLQHAPQQAPPPQQAPGSEPGAAVPSPADAPGLAPVLAAVLDPLLEMVARSAEALSLDSPARLDDGGSLDPAAHKVYLLNCLAACHTALAMRPAAAGRTAQLAAAISSHLDALVGQEVGRLLARAGLAEVVERVRLYRAAAGVAGAGAALPLPSSDPTLSHAALLEGLRRFFVAVSSPDALPEFGPIQAPRLRSDAVARVASSLVAAYEQVHSLLDDPSAGYAEAGGSAAVKHTPAQVRTILGVL